MYFMGTLVAVQHNNDFAIFGAWIWELSQLFPVRLNKYAVCPSKMKWEIGLYCHVFGRNDEIKEAFGVKSAGMTMSKSLLFVH